jgi:epoxide hydrolase-like protein
MSDEQDSLKDKQFSRREFLKLLGAGSLSLGVGIFGISNILKNIREASAINQTAPPVLQGNMSNNKNITNNMNNLNNSDIRPFHVNVPEEELVELHRRINATRWPEKETVTDQTQGVQLATIQKLAHYWTTQHDWRKVEAKLNSLPQFITAIDGLDIHFLHVRSKHENALPLIVTHGWPGSIIEQLKIIDLLTNPTAHGATHLMPFIS